MFSLARCGGRREPCRLLLIVSSLDLHEAQLLVSATGQVEDCASLVFDVCLCAEGEGPATCTQLLLGT